MISLQRFDNLLSIGWQHPVIVAPLQPKEKSMNYKRIVEQLEVAMQSEETWRKTWQSQNTLHKNWATGHTYTGCNQLMCMISTWQRGFETPLWLTWNQVQQLGGTVKGQKATPIIFYGQAKDKSDEEKTYRFGKVYNLFNIEQTGIQVPKQEIRESKLERPHEIADALRVKVENGPHFDPCYRPSSDVIRMPQPEQFESDETYQSTFYHECIHATGHKSRLGRNLTGAFGHEDYAKEELIAEIGSVFLCTALGIQYEIRQHASYLSSWRKAIQDDPSCITKAAKQAQQAYEYCMKEFHQLRIHQSQVA